MTTCILSQTRSYRHLNICEREYISVSRYSGHSCAEIARDLNRHRSTISREVKRNLSLPAARRYSPSDAQSQYHKRISKAHRRCRLKGSLIRKYVYTHLREGWSPEIIAGRLPIDHPGSSTNYESIYQFIYYQRPQWIRLLPRAHRKRRKRKSTPRNRSRIPDRIGIEHRDKKANERMEFGHWEADTMVSRQSSAVLQVLYERASRGVLITKMPKKTAQNMARFTSYNLSRFPAHLRKTITYDNGSENVRHQQVNQAIGTKSYFCTPYHSWEKGGVEQTNGLIRRYFPKRTDFSSLSRYKIKTVERLLNTRPRKCLGFKTPWEVLMKECCT